MNRNHRTRRHLESTTRRRLRLTVNVIFDAVGLVVLLAVGAAFFYLIDDFLRYWT